MWLGRKVQAKGHTEFTLLAVGVFFQFGAIQVRGKIDVGWLDWFPCDCTYNMRDLVVEKARDGVVVSYITARNMLVAESNVAPSDGMPVVAPQRGHMERMDQVAERRISALLKL